MLLTVFFRKAKITLYCEARANFRNFTSFEQWIFPLILMRAHVQQTIVTFTFTPLVIK